MTILDIDGHQLWYETHGEGPPALAMGGWGTFCHGGLGAVPREVRTTREVIVFDYPGVGQSSAGSDRDSTTMRLAQDAIALLDHLRVAAIDIVGLVGLGACVGQQIAIHRPDLVRSLVMTGTWAQPDPTFTDQIDGLRRAHLEAGFETFQLLVASFSFTAEFYNANRDRLLGPDGAWGDLDGRADAHSRLVDACLSHDVLAELETVTCPTLIVHAGRDMITRTDMTQVIERAMPNARGIMWPEISHVIAGREQKMQFDAMLNRFYAAVDDGTHTPTTPAQSSLPDTKDPR